MHTVVDVHAYGDTVHILQVMVRSIVENTLLTLIVSNNCSITGKG